MKKRAQSTIEYAMIVLAASAAVTAFLYAIQRGVSVWYSPFRVEMNESQR